MGFGGLRTYVKIEGKNVEPAIKELEKLAVESPEICVMDTIIDQSLPAPDFTVTQIDEQWLRTYFRLTEAVDTEMFVR